MTIILTDLEKYLLRERHMLILETTVGKDNAAKADLIYDELDELFKKLTQEEISMLNGNGGCTEICKKCSDDPTVWAGTCECGVSI